LLPCGVQQIATLEGHYLDLVSDSIAYCQGCDAGSSTSLYVNNSYPELQHSQQ
jgi:hypothetical protein